MGLEGATPAISSLAVRHFSIACVASGLLTFSCADILGDVDVRGGEDGTLEPIPSAEGIEITPPVDLPPPPENEASPLNPAPSAEERPASELGNTNQPVTDEDPPEPTVAAVCELGSFRCQGAELDLCLNGAAWVAWQTCGSAMLCQSEPAGRCLPQACAADSFRCVDGSLERCDQDLTGWTEVALCATSAHCDPLQGECLAAPCLPGQQRCNGGQLEQCSEDRLGWNVLETCASASLCAAGPAPDTARCVAPTCAAQQYQCTDSGVLQVCNLERTGFSNLAQCASPALCNDELGNCQAPACQPGQTSCSASGEILICNAARTGFTAQSPRVVCGANQTCDGVRGVCQTIQPPPAPPPPGDEDEDEEDDEDDRGGNRGRGNGNGRR